jgi:hypothetical protein
MTSESERSSGSRSRSSRVIISFEIDGSGDDGIDTLLGVVGFFRLSPAEASSALAEVSAVTGRWRDVARKAQEIAGIEPAFDHPLAARAREIATAR